MRQRTGRKRKSSFGSALLLGVIFGILLVMFQELLYQYRLMAQYEANVGSGYVTVVDPEPTATTETTAAPEPTETVEPTATPEPDEIVQTGPPAYYSYDETTGDTLIQIEGIELTINFTSLKAQNSDFVGWLFIPGTEISYPVVQGTDNYKYLDHIFNGSYSKVGTLFADCRNVLMEDENTIIYGHNFHNEGSMFSKLIYYAGQEYYDAHPMIYFLMEDRGYALEVFSTYETPTSDPVYTLTFADSEGYADFLAHVREMSAVETQVEVTPEDKVVTLSTCSNIDSTGRFVVVGKAEQMEISTPMTEAVPSEETE